MPSLPAKGIRVGCKRVARLMTQAGLAGVCRRRFVTTTVKDGDRQAPDLVERNFTAEAPDRLWVADITYVPTWAGFLYLAVVLDAFSRRIVGWSMATTLAKQLVFDALNMALATRRRRDVIHHSDQGSQYTSIEFGRRCRDAGVRPSMGSVGDAGACPRAGRAGPEGQRHVREFLGNPNASRSIGVGSRHRPKRAVRCSNSSRASRTLRHTAHSTAVGDEIAIAYCWHPWAGRTVRVHEVIERTTGVAARCSLVDAAVARVQEIPVWMLDAAACCQTRLAAKPAAALSALAALRMLLLEARQAAATEVPSDAGIASPDSYRGDRHATPSPPAPTTASATRSLVGEPAARTGRGTEMERVAGSDAADIGRLAYSRADGAPRRRGPGAGRTLGGR
jgi:hypothetical protein